MLFDAKLEKAQIYEVVLTGGSSRIPKIQVIKKEFFGKQPNMEPNPDEAVACGAAIHAADLMSQRSNTMQQSNSVRDVMPLSWGIEIKGGKMETVVQSNTPIPANIHHNFTTSVDNQSEVRFAVYEGTRPLVKDNQYHSGFTLHNIPLQPRGVPQFDATFAIDGNGIMS